MGSEMCIRDSHISLPLIGLVPVNGMSTAAIQRADIRRAAYMYAHKVAQVFDVPMYPGAGIMTGPQGMPRDVQELLRPERRIV